jgi:hypothetical protein
VSGFLCHRDLLSTPSVWSKQNARVKGLVFLRKKEGRPRRFGTKTSASWTKEGKGPPLLGGRERGNPALLIASGKVSE